jgi:hypothetical protein
MEKREYPEDWYGLNDIKNGESVFIPGMEREEVNDLIKAYRNHAHHWRWDAILQEVEEVPAGGENPVAGIRVKRILNKPRPAVRLKDVKKKLQPLPDGVMTVSELRDRLRKKNEEDQ